MDLWDSINKTTNDSTYSSSNPFLNGLWGHKANSTKEKSTKPKNFDKYKAEIEKTKAYIKSKREAFYANNNLEEK